MPTVVVDRFTYREVDSAIMAHGQQSQENTSDFPDLQAQSGDSAIHVFNHAVELLRGYDLVELIRDRSMASAYEQFSFPRQQEICMRTSISFRNHDSVIRNPRPIE